jgi:hypothetical protein
MNTNEPLNLVVLAALGGAGPTLDVPTSSKYCLPLLLKVEELQGVYVRVNFTLE